MTRSHISSFGPCKENVALKQSKSTHKRSELGLDLVRVGDGLVTDLVQGIRGIGDQLSQEDFLVGVERIDNP